ncbi:MAG: HDOD domain-containing protein [Nannocystaceae bacterium]
MRNTLAAHVIDEFAALEMSAASREKRLLRVARGVVVQIGGAEKQRIPLLPNIAARAMEVAGDPTVSIRMLESLIQPDPMLTARVLGIANSPLYGKAGQVKSLRNALMLLGVSLMRDILYQTVAEAYIFRGVAKKELRRQRIHAVACGYLAREVFGALGIGTDYAFLCGLMHDVGRTVLMQVLEESPPAELAADDQGRVIELIHPHVGAAAAARWRLPSLAREAVRRHHRYRGFRGAKKTDDDEGYSQIGHAIAATERLAEAVGLGDSGELVPIAEGGDMVLGELGLFGPELDTLILRAQEIRAQMGA